jgi:hypothetical protein
MRWVWLSIFGAVFFGIAWGAQLQGWNVAAAVLGLIMLILFVAALAEFTSHYGEINSEIFERRQRAVNTTPVVMIAESLKALHPENTKLLSKFIAQTVWDVTIDLDRGERDWMLRGYDVHFGLIEFVLDNSKDGKLYPRNKFLEGSRKWDPNGVVEDREQHRQFEQWLSSRLIVVREFGDNHPAMFLPPWTPERLKVVMGFDGPNDLYQPDEQIVIKNLAAQSKPAAVAAQPAQVAKKVESPLTDEQIEKISVLQAEHDVKYKMTVNDFVALNKKTI